MHGETTQLIMRGTSILSLAGCVAAVAVPVTERSIQDGLVQARDVDLSYTQPAHLLKFSDDDTRWVTKHEFNELLEVRATNSSCEWTTC